MLAKVEKLPHVTAVQSPYSALGAHQISADEQTAFATVTFDVLSQNESDDRSPRRSSTPR